ncbi:MAG TPA: hypothetical protein VFS62_08580 [Chloroflexota bacterium]|nr:hypothetical protein [Chloroflexota bacterium]
MPDTKPKGGIRQVWLFTCGGCGATQELPVQTRHYALQMLLDAGCHDSARLGLLCPQCSAKQS